MSAPRASHGCLILSEMFAAHGYGRFLGRAVNGKKVIWSIILQSSGVVAFVGKNKSIPLTCPCL